MELDIKTERADGSCVITVAGEVDVYTSPTLKREIARVMDDGCENVIVDLEKIGFIDSSGLGVLVSALRAMKEQGGTMRLVCSADSILKIFRITGLDKVFPLFASVEEARGF